MDRASQLYYPTDLFLKLTHFCPVNCFDGKYCFARSGKKRREWVNPETLRDVFAQAKEEGLRNVAFISTEPFSNIRLLEKVTRYASEAGLIPRFLDTSGWKVGESSETARDYFQRLKDSGFIVEPGQHYAGTGFTGIDVSVDQFHPLEPEYSANTVLGALEVFGPTQYASIRSTHPASVFNDRAKLNRTLDLLLSSGKVAWIDREKSEIRFSDGSAVLISHYHLIDVGYAAQARKERPEMFVMQQFRPEQFGNCKDLKEFAIAGNGARLLPFHKLYIEPDGLTYPQISRLPCISGGNVFDAGVKQAIENINQNPLVPVLMALGLGGFLEVVKEVSEKPLNLFGTGPESLCGRYMGDDKLMEQVKESIASRGLDKKLSRELGPELQQFREAVLKEKVCYLGPLHWG